MICDAAWCFRAVCSVDCFVESVKIGLKVRPPPLESEVLSPPPSRELLFPAEVGDFSNCYWSTFKFRSSISKSLALFLLIPEAARLLSPIYGGQLPLVFSTSALKKSSGLSLGLAFYV